ncbi:MAG TPA: hypothetical protein VMU80_01545 [Bryobacteraceae bacterium]|nr:hypothetical protein [Bryobacteraceae bacterium]
MNVTGIEWRGQDPNDGRFAAGKRLRRPAKHEEAEEEDVVEIHAEDEDETADGLDQVTEV